MTKRLISARHVGNLWERVSPAHYVAVSVDIPEENQFTRSDVEMQCRAPRAQQQAAYNTHTSVNIHRCWMSYPSPAAISQFVVELHIAGAGTLTTSLIYNK